MKTIAILMSFSAIVVSSQKAFSCTGLSLYLTQPSPYFSSDGPKTGTYNVVVSGNTTAGACPYFVTLDYGSGSSYSTRAFRLSGAEWPYQLYRDAGGLYVLKKVPDGTSCSDVLCGNLAAGSHNISQSQSYSIIIDDTNPWRKAGRYNENVKVTLYRGTPTSYTEIASVYKNISFDSFKKYDISVVATGSAFDLNKRDYKMMFHGMSTGMTRSADIILKYNAGATVYAASENGGKLKHAGQSDTIDYTMSINGVTVPISYWSQIMTKAGVSPASGDVNNVVVTIGNTSGKRKGQYKDTIQLTVQSNE